MRRQRFADLAMTVAVLCLGGSLVFSGFSLLRLRWSSIISGQPLDLSELLGVGCAGAGIALLGWWLLALVCACISGLAQALGASRIAAFTGACSPAFMRRVVISVLGMNLLATPLMGAAQAQGIDPRWESNTVVTGTADSGGETRSPETVLPPIPPDPVEPRWVPRTAAVDPDLVVPPPSRSDPPPADAGSDTGTTASNLPGNGTGESGRATDVVVKSGDTLWSIVARTLGPFSSDVDVALAWPAWYKANLEAIGPDPNYILPGQVLHAPLGQ